MQTLPMNIAKPKPAEERNLLRDLKRGDEAAYAALVDRYGARVFALTKQHTATLADAEDLAQDVFIALAKGIPAFRGECALSTWVYRVALNVCLKSHRRRNPDTLPLLDAETVVAGAATDPFHHAAQGEMRETIDTALQTLSDEHRTVVVLHELHGLTYQECATALQVPVGTVKSRLSNAFKRLRTALAPLLETPSEMLMTHTLLTPAKEVL